MCSNKSLIISNLGDRINNSPCYVLHGRIENNFKKPYVGSDNTLTSFKKYKCKRKWVLVLLLKLNFSNLLVLGLEVIFLYLF